MPGFTPNEGENRLARYIYAREQSLRPANLTLILFTNASVDETTTAAGLTEPSGGGYAVITLVDGTWSITNDNATYAQQTFTFTGTVTGAVQGYAIIADYGNAGEWCLHIEDDPNGPYNFENGSTYDIDLSNTVA